MTEIETRGGNRVVTMDHAQYLVRFPVAQPLTWDATMVHFRRGTPGEDDARAGVTEDDLLAIVEDRFRADGAGAVADIVATARATAALRGELR